MAVSTIPKRAKIIQAGYGAITDVSTSEKDQYITFPTPFPAQPRVVLSIFGGSYNRRLSVKAVSTNGFTATGALLSGSSTAAIEFHWIAVEV